MCIFCQRFIIYQHTMSCNKNVHYLYPPHPYPSWYGPYPTCHNINRAFGECWPYKKLANILISLKIWKRYWLTHWPRGRTEFEEMLSHQERNIFRNPSSTKWSLYIVLFSLSVSLAPKMLKQNFMLESLRPAYTVLTFQSDYSPLCTHCAQAKYKN